MTRDHIRSVARGIGRDNARLALIVAGALVLRVLYVVAHAGRPLTGDGREYYFGARLLADGRGFIRPVEYFFSGEVIQSAQHPPAWTVALAPLPLLRVHGLLAHQLWAACLGAAAVAMVGLAGRRIAGPRAGLIAAAIAAVYPAFWIYEVVLLSETLTLLLTAVCVYVAYGFHARPGMRAAALLGLTCGLLMLTRTEAILLLVLLIAPLTLLARGTDRRTRVKWCGVAAGVMLATAAPWVAYNTARFDNPVLLGTNLGVTLVAANCDQVYEGRMIGWWSFECATEAMEEVGDVGDASSEDLALRRHGLDYVGDNADRVPLVLLAREGRTWGFFQPFQQSRLDWLGDPNHDVVTLAVGAWWLLLPAAVAGTVLLRRRRVPVYPLLVFALVAVIASVVAYGSPRYRAIAEVPAVLLGAVAIDSWLRSPRPEEAAAERANGDVSAPEPLAPVGT
jgi:4-amino-4-deoxy-L-arabinose transferase-like glycosyltransferase